MLHSRILPPFRPPMWYLCAIAGIYILLSCNNENVNAVNHPYENKLGIKPANLAQIDTLHYTTIEWLNSQQQLGTVHHGDTVLLKYRYRNTGVHPLFIYAAHPSCSCTVPQPLPEEAVMPGKEGELKILFNSNGQHGTVYKTITVTTNTSNSVQHTLYYEATVDTFKKN